MRFLDIKEEKKGSRKELLDFNNNKWELIDLLRKDDLLDTIEHKLSISKQTNSKNDIWEVFLDKSYSKHYVDRYVVGYLTYTIGKQFSFHFNYSENFNNCLRLAYYDTLLGYKVYGVENPIRFSNDVKMKIFKMDNWLDENIKSKIEQKILPFINKCLNSEIKDYKLYTQFRRRLNGLLLKGVIEKGISYKNFKNNLDVFFPMGFRLYDFLNNLSDEKLVEMMSSQQINKPIEKLEEKCTNDEYKTLIESYGNNDRLSEYRYKLFKEH